MQTDNNNCDNNNYDREFTSEYLWWKVFRNIYIAKKIFNMNSYFKFDSSNSNENGSCYFIESENGEKIKRESKKPIVYSMSYTYGKFARKNSLINNLNTRNMNNQVHDNTDKHKTTTPTTENNNESNNNHTIVLTDNTLQIGSVWSKTKIPIKTDIEIKFSFQVNKSTDDCKGGDGFAFVVQPNSVNEISKNGSMTSTVGYDGIYKGILAIDFDTTDMENTENNEISIHTQKGGYLTTRHKHKSAEFKFKFNQIHTVEIIYHHKTNSISLSIDSIELFKNIFILDFKFCGSAYFGFTSSTNSRNSGYSCKHIISNCTISKL